MENNTLTEEEELELESRRREYLENPDKTRSWEEIRAELKEKYGI